MKEVSKKENGAQFALLMLMKELDLLDMLVESYAQEELDLHSSELDRTYYCAKRGCADDVRADLRRMVDILRGKIERGDFN